MAGLLVVACATTGLAGPHHAQRKKSKGQLQRDLAHVKSRKAQLRAKLHRTRAQAHAVKSDLKVVDARLVAVKGHLATTQRRLRESRSEQMTVAAKLSVASKRLEATKKQVRARLHAIYVAGGTNGVSALLGTKSGGELASRGGLMRLIERRDRELFERYRREQKEVQSQKAAQDRVVVRIRSLAQDEEVQKRNLAQIRVDKGEALQDLRQQAGELETEIRQFEQDEREIASRIAAFAVRVARRRDGRPLPMFTGRFLRPVNAPITSGFGMRFHPILHRSRLHAGIDFGASTGTPIHAAAAGEVIYAGFMRGFGNVVIVAHGGGISTVYGHASALYVRTGQHLERGATIAAVGSTGLATGPHLHFEVRVNGRPVNPLGRL